jgi:hypothetical protein
MRALGLARVSVGLRDSRIGGSDREGVTRRGTSDTAMVDGAIPYAGVNRLLAR